MLVLSRKPGEHILVGNNIRITIVSIQGRQVRIGIEAPGDVPVFREEVLSGKPATVVAESAEETSPRPRRVGDGGRSRGLFRVR